MQITGNYNYLPSLNFKGNLILKTTEQVREMLPKFDLPHDIWSIPYEQKEQLQKTYLDMLYKAYFDEEGKLIPELTKFLDETIFTFSEENTKTKETVTTTIKDYITKNLHMQEEREATLFHGTQSSEAIEGILKNGFDPKYISRTKMGPGFYFGTEGVALEYGSVIKADVKGRLATAQGEFYQNLSSYPVFSKIAEFLGFKNEFSFESEIQHSFMHKILNQYSKEHIVNNLGIDIIEGWAGNAPSTCVVNLDCISNIRPNWI